MGDRKTSGSKEDLKQFKEEIVHQFHVISENMMNQVKQVAEGVANIDEKLNRRFNDLEAEIDQKTQPIAQAVIELNGKVATLNEKVATLDGKVTVLDEKVATLDRKVTVLDEKVATLDRKVTVLDEKVATLDGKVTVLDEKVATLDGKVTVLDEKVDRIHQELKSDIHETRQEILAAVKFSYAELDRRITNLEKEFLDLKYRLEKLESRPLS